MGGECSCMNYFIMGLICSMVSYVYVGVKFKSEDPPILFFQIIASVVTVVAWPAVIPAIGFYLLGEALVKKFKKPEDEKPRRSY